IKNLLLDKVDIMNTSELAIGGLAGKAENTKVHNVHVTNSKILSSSTDKVSSGGLVGETIKGCLILNSTVQETEVSGSYVGGIVGVADDARVSNVYSTGEARNSLSGELRIGGIIGNGYNYTQVRNSYSTMKVTNGNGILGSDYIIGLKHISIENSISLATITSNNKFKYYNYGVSLLPWTNNFEIEEYTGKSSTTLENLDVTSVSVDQLNQAFFAKQLTWENESIWGIEEDASETKLPYLKNLDPRSKEEKDLSTLTLTTERKEIYVGEELDLTDLIEEVRDKEGQVVDKKEVSITGTVDNSQPGETVVVYTYNGIEKKVTVVVKEKQAKVNVHDSTLYVGDTWQAEDNFDGATDKEGKEVAFEKITVGGDTVDTSKAGRYEVVYSYDGVASKAVVTVKEVQSTAFEKETKITFLEDNETGTIVDPDNPGEGVDPVDPSNPHGAELMISYASNLNFGQQAKTSSSFHALADQVWDDKEAGKTKEVTPFVATKDSRGTSRKGWILTVAQDDAFRDKDSEELKGAEISLSKLAYPVLEGAPQLSSDKIVLTKEAKEVAKAETNQGSGSWTLALGNLEETEQGNEKEQEVNKITRGVTLSVPTTTSKNTGNYMTTVTWELVTDPTVN
ncbi:WxL domain-containing protein, partial [Enterococcus faecalis]|nr:WxL domain-containing protein [Enterococcus faecalis]